MGQLVLSLIQVFQLKTLETEIKHELLTEIYKESCLERTMWVKLYYILKIDENFVKVRKNMDQIVLSLMIFLPYPGLESWVARFKGRYGSSADDTEFMVCVQMDNLVHKDNTNWISSTTSTRWPLILLIA